MSLVVSTSGITIIGGLVQWRQATRFSDL